MSQSVNYNGGISKDKKGANFGSWGRASKMYMTNDEATIPVSYIEDNSYFGK